MRYRLLVRVQLPTSRPWSVLAAFAVGGALSGLAAKLADESTLTWMADLGTSPTVWVLALSLIARFAPTPAGAAVRSAVFFAAMCISYYAWSSVVFGFSGSSALLAGWMALALTVVPVGGALIRWSCERSGLIAGGLLAGAGGVALSDPRVIQLWYAANGALPQDFPLRPVQGMIGIASALVITLVIPRHLATRAWAVALLLPMSLVAVTILDSVRGRLIPG